MEDLTPQAPREPDLPPPACLTDGSGAQIRRDYIKRWKVNDGNKEQRLKEICYTMDLLTSKPIHELVVDAKIYERDFHLLCRGTYLIHNQKYSNRRLILETLIKEDFMTLLKVYWQEVMDEFELKKKEADPKLDNGQLWKDFADTQSYIVEALGNCFHMLVVVWNGSAMKIPQTLSLLYDGTVELFLQALDKYLYPLEVNSIHPQHKVVKAFLGIIHNFCNKHDSSVSDLRERDALRIIGKYRNSGTTTLKTKTILAYSYLLSEEDDKNRSVIELEEADIKFVIAVLKDALNSPDDHSKLYGYHAEELIVGLNNIAVVDSNKQRLVDAGILPLYVGAMGRQKPLLQQCAAQGIWTLGFDEKSMQRIKEEPGCMDALRKLASSTKPDVKVAAKGALWKVEGEIKHLQRVNEKQVKGAQTSKKKLQHIMISYQWDVQEEVMMLREKLKEAGYRVWIDVEQMHKTKTGDTLMAMAKAVSNTVLMIPVLTEKYPVSNACRQEITYANKLNKKLVPVRLQAKYRPEGWLAMLLADVFFYDLTKPSEYEQKIADLIQSLGKDAKILPGESENPASDDEEEAVATITKSVIHPMSQQQVSIHQQEPKLLSQSLPPYNYPVVQSTFSLPTTTTTTELQLPFTPQLPLPPQQLNLLLPPPPRAPGHQLQFQQHLPLPPQPPAPPQREGIHSFTSNPLSKGQSSSNSEKRLAAPEDFLSSSSSSSKVYQQQDRQLQVSKSDNTSHTEVEDFNEWELVGKGAYASVYLYKDSNTNAKLAVKMVDFGPFVNDELTREIKALRNEISLMEKLDHARIVQYIESEEQKTSLCIYMEYMNAGSVKDWLYKHGSLDVLTTKKYTTQMLEGLHYLHKKGIMHRDIKSANILCDGRGNIKLADFGISKRIQTILTLKEETNGHTSCVGTVHWMAPEIINGNKYGTRADVWSAGATVVEMLTTHPPWHHLALVPAMFKIGTEKTANYVLDLSIGDDVRNFLALTFKPEDERPQADELLHHPWLETLGVDS